MSRKPTDLDQAIAESIRARRCEIGLPQTGLAEKVGVATQQIQKYEKGANRVAASMLCRIAEALETTPHALLPAAGAVRKGKPSSEEMLELMTLFAAIVRPERRRAVIEFAKAQTERASSGRGL